MKVVVVGGGIGGIATALAFERRGVDVTVLEQAPAIADVGAGVWTTANGVKALRHLGVDDRVREQVVEAVGHSYLDLEDGHELLCVALGSEAEASYGAPSYLLHRADLLDALMDGLDRTEVRLNAHVTAVEPGAERASVLLESGESLDADLVVGADGLKSAVRASVFGASEPRAADFVSWRALFPLERIREIGLKPNWMHCWFGAGRNAVCYPLRGNTLYNFHGMVPATEVQQESWLLSGDITDLRESFRGSCEELTAVVEAVDDAFVTGLYFRDPSPQWSAPRVTLLGDSAHPTLPTIGQGATMALEDAVTLASCVTGSDDLEAALAAFRARREPRTTRVLESSRANSQMMMLKKPEVGARDGRFKGLQTIDPIGRAVYGWLWEYDVAEEAAKPLSEVIREFGGEVRRQRPEAQRAADMWREVLSPEDRAGGWVGERAAYDRFWLAAFPVPDDVEVEASVPGRGLLTIAPGAEQGPVALHLHGGGYTMGSAESSRELAARLAKAISGTVLTVDYRLGPEHASPAALDDALAAYSWLCDEYGGQREILIFGEGAGGGLAIALAISARQKDLPQPAGIQVVSPMCDLTLRSETIESSVGDDPWLGWRALTFMAASYVQDGDPEDWRMSPIYGDLTGLPPLLIHYAAGEALAGDAVALAETARDAGVEVTFQSVQDSVHSFVLFPFLDEAADVLRQTTQLFSGTKA